MAAIVRSVQVCAHFKKYRLLVGEVAESQRILAALPEDPSSIPSIHVVLENFMST